MRKGDREKFKRLAEQRVNKTIKTVRLIGNLANRSNYSYSDSDVSKIFDALNAEIKACKARFASVVKDTEDKFRLE